MAGAAKLLSRLPVLKSVRMAALPYRITSQACSGSASFELEHLFKEIPEHFNFASDVLDKWTQKEKDGKRPSDLPALWWVGEEGQEVRWSFEELGLLSRKVANVLSGACNLHKGDRVIIILPRVPEWWTITVGCMRAGIVFMPATVLLTAKDILYRLQASKAKCIITNDTVAPLVDSVISDCPLVKNRVLVSKKNREGWLNFHDLLRAASDSHQPVKTLSQDSMSIYFTSGTTGYPKMVEHSCAGHGIGLIVCSKYWMDANPSDIVWGLSDTGWVKFAFGSLYATWIQGLCVFAHGMLQFDPKTVLSCLAKYPVSIFCGTPTIFRMFLQHNLNSYKFKSLRTCMSGGEPTNPELQEQWEAQTGLKIHEGYGQTETTLLCATGPGMKIKPGFIGKPCPPYDVQIIDEHCRPLPPGKEGDIALKIKPSRPLGLFLGYVDDPEKTASTIRGDFYLTGDRGMCDEDGYIQFLGRADDIILSAGYRIGPFEVEHALMGHPAVEESAVISSPDPIRGEVVKALIILSAAYQSHDKQKLTAELQEHVRKQTAPYKYPRKIEFVQQLPKTISGKVQRKELRKKEWARV
ncbi:acyl-coenzyme A synthetase ACSM3, mitochondrial-like [Tiliqua scincoides]|uniref:acyl-coenzyme A synthetase ACSM3, mitochondrial-like n=1 Tax=Tiliqua scincoides TaxID=71010 RepID=UPI003462C112